jgi:hypothetical protein
VRPQPHSYRSLRPEKIVDTIGHLVHRIEGRFPESGLANVARELLRISQEAIVRAERIRQPDMRLRVGIGVLVSVIVALIVALVVRVRLSEEVFLIEHFVQLVDSSLGSVVLIGAAILSLVSLELRLKRNRALKAVHELRALAHIVDMHQLTKDPERVTGREGFDPLTPKRAMTPFELGRYLDYCSELLSLLSKVGALYVQNFPDRVALEAVDQLTNLTNGLARNIWQKIMILETILGPVKPGGGSP